MQQSEILSSAKRCEPFGHGCRRSQGRRLHQRLSHPFFCSFCYAQVPQRRLAPTTTTISFPTRSLDQPFNRRFGLLRLPTADNPPNYVAQAGPGGKCRATFSISQRRLERPKWRWSRASFRRGSRRTASDGLQMAVVTSQLTELIDSNSSSLSLSSLLQSRGQTSRDQLARWPICLSAPSKCFVLPRLLPR